MAKAIARGGGWNPRWGEFAAGDTLEGPVSDLTPLVESGVAQWEEPAKPKRARKSRRRPRPNEEG
jgi:hypothetical protein